VSADQDGYWVVVGVDRSTAAAATELWPRGDAAWEHAVELEVPRRLHHGGSRHRYPREEEPMTTIDEQATIDGLGLKAERIEQITWYANQRGGDMMLAIRELIAEGLLSILLATQAAANAATLEEDV
jgi:hypothetical protein